MIVDCAVYERGVRHRGRLTVEEACKLGHEPDAFVWIGIHEPTMDEFDAVRREFELHPLAVEDAVIAHQRPKVEAYDDTLFVVLKTARYDDPTETIDSGELQIFVGSGFVITVRHGQASPLSEVRRTIEGQPDLLALGPSAVLHAIVDCVVDDYEPAIAGLENDIDEVERDVFSPEPTNPAERIYKLKREVLEFHRDAAPLLEPLGRLAQGRYLNIPPTLAEYFRDVEDHLRRVVASLDNYRDLLNSVLEANLAQISVRQNEEMRRVSAWGAIVLVPTLFAGIWGMNFEHMPELDWRIGYPLALGAMVGVAVALYLRFKRAGWF